MQIAEKRRQFQDKREEEKLKELPSEGDQKREPCNDEVAAGSATAEMEAFLAAEKATLPFIGASVGDHCGDEEDCVVPDGDETSTAAAMAAGGKQLDESKWWLKGIPKEAQKTLEEMDNDEPSIFT